MMVDPLTFAHVYPLFVDQKRFLHVYSLMVDPVTLAGSKSRGFPRRTWNLAELLVKALVKSTAFRRSAVSTKPGQASNQPAIIPAHRNTGSRGQLIRFEVRTGLKHLLSNIGCMKVVPPSTTIPASTQQLLVYRGF